MTTTEKNKLIAEFMGFENASNFVGGSLEMRKKTKIKFGTQQYESYKYDDLKYHSSWVWLMPVVEKIENENPISFIISCGNCEVYNCEKAETMFFFEGVKIQAVFEAVINFIQWYNTQNDLFKNPPKETEKAIDKFNSISEPSYDDCKELIKELNAVGYTCEYDLDAVPFNLKKM